MSTTYTALRQAFRDRILGLAGWTEALVPYGRFGADPASVQHLRFAVGMPRTEDSGQLRQKPSEGARVDTAVAVTFAHRVLPKDQLTSVDSALDAELALIQRIMDVETDASWPGEISVRYSGTERNLADSGEWLIVEVSFAARILLPLS